MTTRDIQTPPPGTKVKEFLHLGREWRDIRKCTACSFPRRVLIRERTVVDGSSGKRLELKEWDWTSLCSACRAIADARYYQAKSEAAFAKARDIMRRRAKL